MGTINDALQRALEAQFTQKPPVSTKKRVEFLMGKLKKTKAVAELLGVSQRSVERYLKGERLNPPKDIAERLEREVRARFQPLVRKRAARRAASTTGITIETRAAFGYTAPIGTTDEARVRRITQHLPPAYAARLFDAHQTGAGEDQLTAIIAEGLQELYFKDDGRRAQQLQVRLTDIDYLDADL
ncbi:putative transcriptional regulator [Streptacidiphilus sp. MAP12-20]|uniref:telomere-protecting terminal protein Tpg n=1 Tax=Streptacidiphilus sp. MAP12-20 TaxID=3156299 RepID=UPI003517C457